MKNIGLVFVKMGQYNDAVNTYEHIMQENADIETGTGHSLFTFNPSFAYIPSRRNPK